MDGYTLSGESLKVIKRTVDDVVSLKQQVKQVQSQYLPGMPMEIFVPRSFDEDTEIYTGDLYIRDPATGSYLLMIEDQTGELLPDSL